MATINFGKVKLIYQGEYNPNKEYSAGDIVSFGSTCGDVGGAFQHATPNFIFKNGTPKTGSYPYLRTTVVLANSVGVHTNKVDIKIASINNPGTTQHTYVVPNRTEIQGEFFYSGTKVIGVEDIPSGDPAFYNARLTLSKYSVNEVGTGATTIVLGAPRGATRYDIVRNDVDWDIYSSAFIFRGDWDENSTYEVGNIVVRENQSYICKAPTGAGTTFIDIDTYAVNTGILGPSTTRSTADPIWDYHDNWEVYISGDLSCEKEKKFGLLPNTNPVDWRGHPYIKPPTWGMTGVGSYYQGGTPWTGPAGFTTSPHAWRWQRNSEVNSEGRLWAMSQAGEPMSMGGLADIDAGSTPNVGGNAGTVVGGAMQVVDVYDNVSWWSGEYTSTGGEPVLYNKNSAFTSKTKPMPVQWFVSQTNRMYLFSNGIVGTSGASSTQSLNATGSSADNDTNGVVEINPNMFKGRKIVKIDSYSSVHQATDSNDGYCFALDEYGELHGWGNNASYTLGIGSESGDYAGLANQYMGSRALAQLVPVHLPKDERFAMPRDSGGKRIVDFWINGRSVWALDEDGETWAWGDNTVGSLGYPTDTAIDVNYGGVGFFDQTYASRPYPHSYMGVLGYDYTTSPLTNVVGVGTAITQLVAGTSYQKDNGAGNGWSHQIYSTTPYTGSVVVKASSGGSTTDYGVDEGYVAFGLHDAPWENVSYTTLNAGWMFVDSGYIQIVKNGTNSDPIMGGASGLYKYNKNTVVSVVYDHDTGFFHWYYDFMGDGRCVQMVERKHKTDVGVASSTTTLYFDSSFHSQRVILHSIGVTTSITKKTWADYGGIQKVAGMRYMEDATMAILDGQGYVWTCGDNDMGQLGNGANSTAPNNTACLQRRYFSEYINSTGQMVGVGSFTMGLINNIWTSGSKEPNLFFQAQDRFDSNNHWIYGVGHNSTRILCDGTTTNKDYAVTIPAMSGQGTYAGVTVGIGSTMRNIVHMQTAVAPEANCQYSDCVWALSASGEIWAGGNDGLGASAAVNIETSDNSDICNNVSVMQQFGGGTESWQRLWFPSRVQRSIVAVEGSGHRILAAPYTTYKSAMWLLSDGSGLWCGDAPNATVQNQTFRAPMTIPGFGY